MTSAVRRLRVGWHRRRRGGGVRGNFLLVALAGLGGLSCATFGAGWPIEEDLGLVRAQLRSQPASGDVVIVEIDAASIARYHSWPWPRRHHAKLVDRLRMAGARSVAFDVDFSAPSRSGDDAAFAAAIERFPGGVVLPTFRQAASSRTSALVESLPIPVLRERAFLGSVNVFPDGDGSVRHYPFGVVTGGIPRPSLGAAVAESAGNTDRSFTIDQAIDPATVPRFGFADVAEGRVPARAFSGKRVIVGATAIELGDRYVLPRYGLLPGVIVQALAAETLMSGHLLPDLGGLPLLFLALGVGAMLRRPGYRQTAALAFCGLLIAVPLPLLAEALQIARLSAVPGLAVIATMLFGHLVQLIAAMLHRARFIDGETGLPNAAALQAAIGREAPAGLTVMRIDRYQDVVAGLGRDERAQLLAAIVARVRIGNGGADLYRVDGGQFAWMTATADPGTAAGTATLVEARLSLPSSELKLRVFMGLAAATDGAPDLLAHAAQAAQTAQRRGIAMLSYEPRMAAEAADAMQFVADIDRALAAGEFTLDYQPKQYLATARLAGVEALVRWQHPVRGRVSPADFVPVIETQGWESRLALAVVERAIADSVAWRAAGFETVVAINLSASLLSDAALCLDLVSRIDAAGLPHAGFAFEVTESAVIGDAAASAASLQRFRALGFKISIDDYGTGQSTLSYLQRLPADEIKIDQSFVRNITTRRADAILVRSTIELAHEMGMVVVAEGIEDAATLNTLRSLGADIGQGYVIARPMAATLVAAWVSGADAKAARSTCADAQFA